MSDFPVTGHGARGDGEHDDARAIQAAIDACAAAGGGRVVLPAGRIYLSGSLALRPRVELHVERGAVLRASADRAAYTGKSFGSGPQAPKVFLGGDGAEDCAITGGGVIDGQGKRFMREELPHIWVPVGDWRPHLICLTRCHRLTVRDVTIRDSANWALHLTGCNDVVIEGIRILNDLKVPNCDGIDPDHCRNVRIADCHIEAGDDCIVIKNRAEHPECGPSENIVVSNCTLISTSCAVKIGTETIDDVRDVIVQGCVIRGSHRGLGIMLRDQGTVENVLFSDCIVETRHFHEDWWGKAEPIHVSAFPRRADTRLGRIRNVRFRNILCRGENGVYLAGAADGHIEGIALSDVRIEIARTSRWPGGVHDRRPCAVPGLVPHATTGVYAAHVADLALREVQVRWGAEPPPDARHALEAYACPGLRLERFAGEAAFPGIAAQVVEDARG